MTWLESYIAAAAFGALFVLGAISLSGRADEAAEKLARDRADGDCWPYVPQVFPHHGSEE